MAKRRTPIPSVVQARIQFEADRTCCVCRTPGKPIQIHHIDENPSNHSIENLAVLCRDCHDLTMIRGTFNRKLDADVVTLYRDDWREIVVNKRARPSTDKNAGQGAGDLSGLTLERLEILKERKQYFLLAIDYAHIGNIALRDKYVDLALKENPPDSTIIFLRGLQNKPELIPDDVILRERERELKDQLQLARTLSSVKDYKNSIASYCRGIVETLEEGNVFSAAYYLKELSTRALYKPLFEETYEKRKAEKDHWWAIRSLHELEWHDEANDYLRKNAEEIRRLSHPMLLQYLALAEGDLDRYKELSLDMARTSEIITLRRPSPKRPTRPKSKSQKKKKSDGL